MKNILITLAIFLMGFSVYKAGWSYSGSNTFTLKQESTVYLYHNKNRSTPYFKSEGNPYYIKNLKSGKYVLTIEGYYFMEFK